MTNEKAEENQNNRIVPILAAAKQAGLIAQPPAEEGKTTSEKIMSKMANVDGGPWTGGNLPRGNPNDDAASKMQTKSMTEYGGQSISDRIGGTLTGAKSSASPRDASIQLDQASDMTSYPRAQKSGVEKNTRSPAGTPDLVRGDPSTQPLQFGERPATVQSRTTGDADLVIAKGDQTRTVNRDKK